MKIETETTDDRLELMKIETETETTDEDRD